ncbi:hypothetical protein Slin14017_G117500 [Septoria linicola]|nr:hypothetical protein Slin14017_G117500 [Septoria linicola]
MDEVPIFDHEFREIIELLSSDDDYPDHPPRSDSLLPFHPQSQYRGFRSSMARVDSATDIAVSRTRPNDEHQEYLPARRPAVPHHIVELEVPTHDPPSYTESAGNTESAGRTESGMPILITLKNYAYIHSSPTSTIPSLGPCTASCTDIALLTPTSSADSLLQACIDRAVQTFNWPSYNESDDGGDVLPPQALVEVYVNVDGRSVLVTEGNWPAARALLLEGERGARLCVVMSRVGVMGEMGVRRKVACWVRRVGRWVRGDGVVL